jgi:Rifampin ADP-ribosyl transferase
MDNNLSSRQFFHGTDAQLQPGDMLHPNHSTEGFNKERPDHTDFVWMSNRVKDADWYANRRSGTPTRTGTSGGHVYEVEPQGLHAPADTLTPGKKSNSTHVSLAPAKVIREVPHDERRG